jgi:ABC-2 type transport system permease protein
VALRWRSFAVACGLGMGATVMGFLIGQSMKFGPWYPWSLPVQMMSTGDGHARVLALSAIGALLVAGLGTWRFARRDHD